MVHTASQVRIGCCLPIQLAACVGGDCYIWGRLGIGDCASAVLGRKVRGGGSFSLLQRLWVAHGPWVARDTCESGHQCGTLGRVHQHPLRLDRFCDCVYWGCWRLLGLNVPLQRGGGHQQQLSRVFAAV
eukprot:scaffold141076_cov42-Prasinocladus_malaysianus.AAC.4